LIVVSVVVVVVVTGAADEVSAGGGADWLRAVTSAAVRNKAETRSGRVLMGSFLV
jgi:hypothetical protein